MKITLSQLNVMVGDILSNKSKNIDYIDEAADSGADPALPCLLWEGCKMPLADDVYRDKEPPKQ